MADDERLLGRGTSGMVSVYDAETVLKCYVVWLDGRRRYVREPSDDCKVLLDHEYAVYKRLGTHPHILRHFGFVEVEPGIHSLRLELAAKGDLRAYIRKNPPDIVSNVECLEWLVNISSAVVHVHSCGVYHCDITCRNILLTSNNIPKLSDFGSSKMDGLEPRTAEEMWYELPLRGRAWKDRPYVQKELFALGCAVYEIMAWNKPFGEFTADKVEQRYAAEEFPDTQGVLGEDIIWRCWREEYKSAADACKDLTALYDALRTDQSGITKGTAHES